MKLLNSLIATCHFLVRDLKTDKCIITIIAINDLGEPLTSATSEMELLGVQIFVLCGCFKKKFFFWLVIPHRVIPT